MYIENLQTSVVDTIRTFPGEIVSIQVVKYPIHQLGKHLVIFPYFQISYQVQLAILAANFRYRHVIYVINHYVL